MARGGDGAEKSSRENEEEKTKRGQRDEDADVKRRVIKLLLVFEMTGHMKSVQLYFILLNEELVCLCWKESALFRALQENNEKLLFFASIIFIYCFSFLTNHLKSSTFHRN